MEEYNKALVEKKYVDAANNLEKVRAANITLKHTLQINKRGFLKKNRGKNSIICS